MPSSQAPAGARWIFGGWRRSGWLWCCGRSWWWCSWRLTKRSSPAGSGRRRMGLVREGYKVVALLLKPSLGLFGLLGRRRVLLPHPGSVIGYLIAPGDHHTLQHILVHFGVDFQADFEDVRWHDVAITWNHTKDHNRSLKLGFHHPGHVPVICGNPAMVLAVMHLILAEVLFVWKKQKKKQSMFGFLGCFSFLSNLTDLISLRFFVFSVKIWLVWRL